MSLVEIALDSVRTALRPFPRDAGLGLLLGAEVLVLTVRFDATPLRGRGWLADLIHDSSHVPQVAGLAAVAALMIGGARLLEDLRTAATGPHRGAMSFVLAHLAAFVSFAVLTALVMDVTAGPIPSARLAAAWAAAGFVTFALWGAAVIPPSSWLPLARRASGALAGGTAVGLAAWGAGRLTGQLWRPMSRWTFEVVAALLSLVTDQVVCLPAQFIVGTPDFRVCIAPECAGYEGIGLLWVLLGAYLWLARGDLRFPWALLLLPVGTAAIWLANAVRIAALVAVGSWWSPAVAQGGFHSQAGWMALLAVGLGLVAVSRRSRLLARHAGHATEHAGPAPAVAYLAPEMAVLATAMVAGAVSHGVDWLYPLRIPAAGLALRAFRGSHPWLYRVPSWESVALGALVFAVWTALEPAPASGGHAADTLAAGIAALPTWAALAWLIARVVGSVVTVPLVEELAFRGYLLRRLAGDSSLEDEAPRFIWGPVLISSLVFGALHGRWLAGTFAGLIYALAFYRRGRLSDAVCAHAVTNALIAADVLATGSWSLWT